MQFIGKNIVVYIKTIVFKDAIMSKIASASQPEDGSSEPPEVDFSQIYLEEVGVKKTRIYSLGSQAPFYGHVGASFSSISPLQDLDFNARVNECVGHRLQEIKEEMKHEMNSSMFFVLFKCFLDLLKL
nr:uncharacterized protein LOC104104544 isoform X2 [Nicotiana tomentosiformis]